MTIVQCKKTHRMSFLLWVTNLLSQNCYTFAVYSQLCLSKTKVNYIPLCPRRHLRPINSQLRPNQQRGRSSKCKHLFRHWWRIKDYQNTFRLYLCKYVDPNCKIDCVGLVRNKTDNHFIGMLFWYSCENMWSFRGNGVPLSHKINFMLTTPTRLS